MSGRRLAHYEINELLGKGGMGEVHLARDTKLDRDVAIKILPREIAQDAERLARFRREARVLASLNHTSIAAIHGLEEADGELFLVLELAAGEDLSQRMRRGALSIDDTVNVARQLAHGLEQAHERGVVHRDLKPANVKLSDDGVVKILDFGLARAYAGESAAEGDMGSSPTITAAMTQAGTILGTAAYMSPEQARGLEVDRRADIWAFGVILYEMLTGTRLFDGETISDTLAEVIKTEPDFAALPSDTPDAVRWLVERCLQKRPSKRLRDIGEARILLESDLDQMPVTTISGPAIVTVERPRWVVPALVASVVLSIGLGVVLARSLDDAPPPRGVQATLNAPDGHQIRLSDGGHVAMSPDGSRVAFVAVDTMGVERLWVRRLDTREAYVLSGTDGASYPFWSPDSDQIGFFSSGRLRRIDAGGGVPTAVCEAPNGRGGTWTRDDRILFAFEIRDHLQLVSAAGGEPRALTTTDSLHWSHRWPVVLPDDEHFLHVRAGDVDELRWRSIDSATDEIVLLTEVNRAQYADGHLFFGRGGGLWARPFDPDTGEFLGQELLVAESVIISENFKSGVYGVAEDGTLVYATGQVFVDSYFAVFDSMGRETERIDFPGNYAEDLNLSPDGRLLAITLYPSEGSANSGIWIRDMRRGTLSRFTNDEGIDDPIWDPQGERIAYSTGNGLVVRSTRGRREILAEVEVGDDIIPHDWSRDGRFLVATISDANRSIWIVPVDDPDGRYPLVQNGQFNVHPTFSPDGRWIAFMSVETGDPMIYVREIGTDGGTWPVSRGFGIQPRWSRNGDRIYFVDQEGIVSVDASFTDRGPEFGEEERAVQATFLGGRSNTHRYDMDDDATRFIVQIDPSGRIVDQQTLELMVGWRAIVGAR